MAENTRYEAHYADENDTLHLLTQDNEDPLLIGEIIASYGMELNDIDSIWFEPGRWIRGLKDAKD